MVAFFATEENARAMNPFTKTFIMLVFLAAFPAMGQTAAPECAANWSTSEYKSFGDLQSEVKKRYGEVRILRVALCNPGDNPYFQVVIISGHGEVRRIQLAAVN
jgi:hypothetical protein